MEPRAPGPPPARRRRSRLLEPRALLALENLKFAARRIVEGTFSGRHRSRMRGSSVEFADYREYAPGDDLRRLDWKVLLRLGRPFVRTYDEETNLRCLLVLDTSASMAFGAEGPAGISKLDYGRFLLAALAWLVVQSRDQAGVALGADRLEAFVEPRGSRPHLDRVLHALERAKPSPRTRLGAVIEEAVALLKRRAVLVVCSDFLEEPLGPLFRLFRSLRHRRFELILFHLLDPLERDLPAAAAWRFLDPEGPLRVDARVAEIRAAYRERLRAFLEEVRGGALGAGCDYERIETERPYPDALRRFLRFRESR